MISSRIDSPDFSSALFCARRAPVEPDVHPEAGEALYRLVVVARALASSQIVLDSGFERTVLCASCGARTAIGTTLQHQPNCLSAEVIRLVERIRGLNLQFDRKEDASGSETGAAAGNRPRSDMQSSGGLTSPDSVYLPLAHAYLCQDCDCIGNQTRRCPACASEVLLALAPVLNRETKVPA